MDAPNRCSPEIDESGLPLPSQFPEYLTCPNCGEPEVEVWCYEKEAVCYNCGCVFPHPLPRCFGSKNCKVQLPEKDEQ
jgi:hypothetical protein